MTNSSAISPQDSRDAVGPRERILHTTLDLIGREGIGELSNRRIAGAAGVSLGSLTYHCSQPGLAAARWHCSSWAPAATTLVP